MSDLTWCTVDPKVMPPRPTGEAFTFGTLKSANLRQWAEKHPGHIDDWDSIGRTALYAAANRKDCLALVQWLIDTQGADVNRRTQRGYNALYVAKNPLIVRALLERGANPANNISFNSIFANGWGTTRGTLRNGTTMGILLCTSPREEEGKALAKVWPSSNG